MSMGVFIQKKRRLCIRYDFYRTCSIPEALHLPQTFAPAVVYAGPVAHADGVVFRLRDALSFGAAGRRGAGGRGGL